MLDAHANGAQRGPAEQTTVTQDNRRLGTLQVDVDELWVYYESIGLEPPKDGLSRVYEQGIPRLLDLFDRYGVRATFFVCGRDLPAQGQTLRAMVTRGHEVANHSTEHPVGYARLSPQDKLVDVATTHRLIWKATGQPPVGFKSPGFSFAPDQLDILASMGYLYDSSLLPSYYAPVLRVAQRLFSGGQVDPSHYGRAIHGLAPQQPYRPDGATPYRRRQQPISTAAPGNSPRTKSCVGGRPARGDAALARRSNCHPDIWEAPVTTMPLLRLPIHSTFVLSAGRPLFDVGLAVTRWRRGLMNYLLHAADVIDDVMDPALESYRFLTLSWEAKRPLYEHMLSSLSAAYRLIPTREFITAWAQCVG